MHVLAYYAYYAYHACGSTSMETGMQGDKGFSQRFPFASRHPPSWDGNSCSKVRKKAAGLRRQRD